ncbi:MAG TPA: hypothetical protein VGV15_03245, partial [Terriglobales bacterium]|nr:hypothetical protein [Terriglobales bacterium]
MTFMPKTNVVLITFVSSVLTMLSAQAQSVSSKQTMRLDSGWEFRQMLEAPEPPAATASSTDIPATTWRPAQVPGDVHLDLLRNHLI